MSKRKKKTSQPVKRGSGQQVSSKISKTYFEQCCRVARKLIQYSGLDPALFDAFTKKQRQAMFRLRVEYPRVRHEPGHRVPRQYIKLIQSVLLDFLREEIFDEPSGLTMMDVACHGMCFTLMIVNGANEEALPPAQREIVDRIKERFIETDLLEKITREIFSLVKTNLMLYSQANFRVYGFNVELQAVHAAGHVAMCALIVEHACQTARFNHRNVERVGFRLAVGKSVNMDYQGVRISLKRIYPGASVDKLLNVYVQSHAIHRFKERVDTVYPILRNHFFMNSLLFEQRVVEGPGGLKLITCLSPRDQPVGYFTFTIDGDNLLVLTLLPLLSPSVPEGSIFCKRLNLGIEELKFLGMDKLSFFYDVDVEQIPLLKKVLIDELHLGYIRKIYNSYQDASGDYSFNEQKTLFVKNFFSKIEEQQADKRSILDQIAAAEQPDSREERGNPPSPINV
jgi:hypothetical protein